MPRKRKSKVARPEIYWGEPLVREYRVEEYVQASTSGANDEGKSFWNGEDVKERLNFYGCTDPREAHHLGTYGWAEGRELVDSLKVNIEGRLGNHNRQYVPVHDVSGAYVDVGRYCEGVPECMLTFEETDSPQSGFVWIHVSTGVAGSITTEQIRLHGAAVGALIDALESQGQRVKLTWERSSKGNENNASITLWMTLKEYDDPLDMDRLAFFLTHNAPRRIMAWHEYLKAPKALRDMLGIEPGRAGCWPCSNPMFKEADIHIEHMPFREEGDAAEWILAKLEKQGIKIAE